MTNFRELGFLYKKVRQSRGYSINDVASEYVNKSQISKFENGNSMLLMDGFMHAVLGLNMTIPEFFLAIGEFESSCLQPYNDQLQQLNHKQDIAGLKKLIITKPRTTEKKIFNIKVKCAIRELSRENLLTTEECQFIDSYLTNREEWTFFDITVFGMCLEALDTDLVCQLGLQLMEKHKMYNLLPYNARVVKRTLVSVYVHLIIHGRFLYATEFEKQINLLLEPVDTDEKIVMQLFKKVITCRQDKNFVLLSELGRDVQSLKALGADGLAKRIELFLFND